jgi:hypothetical protein
MTFKNYLLYVQHAVSLNRAFSFSRNVPMCNNTCTIAIAVINATVKANEVGVSPLRNTHTAAAIPNAKEGISAPAKILIFQTEASVIFIPLVPVFSYKIQDGMLVKFKANPITNNIKGDSAMMIENTPNTVGAMMLPNNVNNIMANQGPMCNAVVIINATSAMYFCFNTIFLFYITTMTTV